MRDDDRISVTDRIEHRAPGRLADLEPEVEPAGARSAGTDGRSRRRTRSPFLRELPGTLLLALVLAILIKTFVLQAFFIPSTSMLPTFEIDDRVLVSKLAYSFHDPEQGDVIVFGSPLLSGERSVSFWENLVRNVLEAVGIRTAGVEDLIKRVVAVGGDRLEIRANRVWVNDMALDEPYLAPGYRMADFGPFYIPAGYVWVMGDNRNNSHDSRRYGPIPMDEIRGRAIVRFWPFARWERL